jgi:rSAM/selenodomain-associated transferase 2
MRWIMTSPEEQFKNKISVVIPTLNAGATLPTLLPLLRVATVSEIVVCDGGSHDDTVAIARAAGAEIVAAARGRGAQLAAGAGAARGAWLLFLHADCRPLPGWDEAVRSFIERPQAAARAGYFDLAFDDPATAARRLERGVAWRCRHLALPYGDQGLLIARTLYDTLGGFAPLPLMEDVDLVRRLGRRRLQPIGATLSTSASRYRRDGWLLRPLRNLACLALYFAGVPPRAIARLYG